MRSRGGFTACLNELAGMRQLLLTFLMVDVLTATFRESSRLDPALTDMQEEYLLQLPYLEHEIVANTDLCPQFLLQAIIQVTSLRAGSRKAISYEIEDLYYSIQAFDTESWATRTLDQGIVRPHRSEHHPSPRSVEAWSALALCHKFVTLLYFLISFPLDYGMEKQKQEKEQAACVSSDLSNLIQLLFSMAESDSDAPVETQLWKFINWPILISIYADAASQTRPGNVRSNVERLEMVAMATGIRPWLHMASDLQSRPQAI